MKNTYQTSQSLSETDRQKKCKEYQDKQAGLLKELELTNNDLANARANGEPTWPYYAAKQKIDDDIKRNQMDIENYCYAIADKEPGDDNQTVVSAAAVRRKLPSEISPQ